jgi:hypothetical protein
MTKQSKSRAQALPGKAKLMANLSVVTAEDRARAGISDADIQKQQAVANPKGVQVVRGPFQADAASDVEEQVRVIDYDQNKVLFSGSASEYNALKKALG